jgi:hypothetical protein
VIAPARSGKGPESPRSLRGFRDSSLPHGPGRAARLESTHRRTPPENRMNAFALLMSLTFFAPIALNVAMNVVGLRDAA